MRSEREGRRTERLRGSNGSPVRVGCLYDDPERCRALAEEMRMVAEEIKDIQAKAIMDRIAEEYLRLAEWAEVHAGRRKISNGGIARF